MESLGARGPRKGAPGSQRVYKKILGFFSPLFLSFFSLKHASRPAQVTELQCSIMGICVSTWTSERKPISLARGTGKKRMFVVQKCRVIFLLSFSLFPLMSSPYGQPQLCGTTRQYKVLKLLVLSAQQTKIDDPQELRSTSRTGTRVRQHRGLGGKF